MRNLSVNGIVLRKQTRGEHDLFITLYSPELGKIQAAARGARKIDSAFTGHLEILNICKFQIYKNAHSYTITECKAQSTFRLLRDDFEKSILALLLLDIFQQSAHTPENGAALFSLFDETLNLLSGSANHALCVESFKIKLLGLLGVMPEISHCSFCGLRWKNGDAVFIDKEGHPTCTPCRKPDSTHEEIPFNMMKLIHHLSREPVKNCLNVKLTKKEENTLRGLSTTFLQNYLNRELNSEKVLAQLRM